MNIKTERLIIQHLDSTDVSFILQLLNEPAFHQNIGDKGVRSEEDALDYIRTAGTENYSQFGFGMFRVGLKATGHAIGICGLLQRAFLDSPDIGFAFLESSWNNGYGTEAALSIRTWAEHELGIVKLKAFTSLINRPSIRVLEKVGFKSLGEQELPENKGRCHVLEWKSTC